MNLKIVFITIFVFAAMVDVLPLRTEEIKVNRDMVPVIPSNRPIITGINPDAVFSRYISDYERFEHSCSMPSPWGIVWRWRVKPDSNDPSTAYFWGDKRDTPAYQRFIKLDIGVFPSHRDAIYAVSMIIRQAVPKLNPLNPDDPGFVSWSMGDYGQEHYEFVRDNVYVGLQLSESFNPKEVSARFDRELKEGAAGIFKNGKLEPVEILDATFPSEISDWNNGVFTMFLGVRDPNKLKFWPIIWFDERQPMGSGPKDWSKVMLPFPALTWNPPGFLELKTTGALDQELTLRAAVINEYCVVVNDWKKKVKIKAPALPVAPDAGNETKIHNWPLYKTPPLQK